MAGILRASAAAYPEIEFLSAVEGMPELFQLLEHQPVDVAIVGITGQGLSACYQVAAEGYGHLRVFEIDADSDTVIAFERRFIARRLPCELNADVLMRLIVGREV